MGIDCPPFPIAASEIFGQYGLRNRRTLMPSIGPIRRTRERSEWRRFGFPGIRARADGSPELHQDCTCRIFQSLRFARTPVRSVDFVVYPAAPPPPLALFLVSESGAGFQLLVNDDSAIVAASGERVAESEL